MSYSDTVATLSFIIACAAFIMPYWRDRKAKQKERRKELLEIFTRTQWSNEGDVLTTPKAHYTLDLKKGDGLSNVYGTLWINVDESYYEFNGEIDSKGVLKTKLKMPIGKWGAYIAKAKFIYSEDSGQITYMFDGFIDNKDMASANDVLDTVQKLWRASTA
ncbi:hypothetical protein UL24_03995 [Salmonella enterica]|uniref:Uncharacterized protein n=1 Tax=Salmonella enterica TaxID=28901 RepID=A0A743Z672_SALER|nr:hypothetical protein [Salmonella enterica]EDA1261031.1 hypothetical protein [Salmonella enterica subsp. enterica serovar Idikan]EDN4226287.1 hypothetical protein [Salmonella enterica subsp. enterica serovar Pomona]EED8493723.1 hypothetical protein [Salmonella enterica subsp. enterica]EHL4602455.1 hypothetical protein [Salmonella enterica subsp. enterica serovar Glostrup]ELE5229220.1 hypothetical protein [Salmonella enterica subsp. enterica serovar Colindale]HBI5502786.1 hypothetical protei